MDAPPPPCGPFDLIEETPDGPHVIAQTMTYGWAVQLVAMLNADLGDDGRQFAFRLALASYDAHLTPLR